MKHLLQACLPLSIIIFSAFSSAAKTTNDEKLFQQITGSATRAVFLNRNQMPSIPPDALVRDLYRTHTKNSSAIVQGKNRIILDKYFEKRLADFIWKDAITHQDEVGVIDFDLFYNAQDIRVSNMVIKPAKINGNRATVAVTFDNYKRKNKLTYLLVKENSVWKITDINYGKGETLLHYFDNIT